MLLQKDDPVHQAQWQFTLNELAKIYSFCKNKNIKVILLIFPFTFQFNNNNLAWAQRLLRKNATDFGIRYIDYLELFEKEIKSNPNMLNEYYLDEDHFTPMGNKIVAKELATNILKML